MASKKILTVIGTRPNYIKVTQLEKAFSNYKNEFEYRLLHTGQHYDALMKDIFFQQLRLRKMDYALEINHGTAGEQIGEMISGIDAVLNEWNPDLMIVVGDVNSTLAASIAANKTNTKLAHMESGLRSFDNSMPEEWNRRVTDQLADVLFITEKSGEENLLNEGKQKNQLFFVGNTMIDTLIAFESAIDEMKILQQLNLTERSYVLITIHRPSNVDDENSLEKVLRVIEMIATKYRIIFPIHPRTQKNLDQFQLRNRARSIQNLSLIKPLDYFSFQKLIKHCAFVLTDSGGIQEETTYRKIPCLTLRENTERPSTIEFGTNELLLFDENLIQEKIFAIEHGTFKKGSIPPLWDGKASERIAEILRDIL